jgi:hypothetical protein
MVVSAAGLHIGVRVDLRVEIDPGLHPRVEIVWRSRSDRGIDAQLRDECRAAAGAMQRDVHRAATVAERERRATLDQLASHRHAPAPAGMAEPDVLAIRVAVDSRARVEQASHRREQASHRLELATLDGEAQHLVEAW